MTTIAMLASWRAHTARLVAPLSDAAWTAIPAGFSNNILWNLGHVVVTQQLLHYGRCGLPLHVPDAWLGWFRKGTSPADWTATPDRQSVLHALTDLPARLAADYEAGVFTAFQPYETSTGITLHTLADALAFNNIHEGMHVGTILALRRHVR